MYDSNRDLILTNLIATAENVEINRRILEVTISHSIDSAQHYTAIEKLLKEIITELKNKVDRDE